MLNNQMVYHEWPGVIFHTACIGYTMIYLAAPCLFSLTIFSLLMILRSLPKSLISLITCLLCSFSVGDHLAFQHFLDSSPGTAMVCSRRWLEHGRRLVDWGLLGGFYKWGCPYFRKPPFDAICILQLEGGLSSRGYMFTLSAAARMRWWTTRRRRGDL